MAGRLNSCIGFSISLTATLGCSLAHAELPDPTRPPLAVLDSPAPGAAATLSGLQTVILRKGQKSMALINGQIVEIGGKVGEATLVRLTESEAELRGPGGKEILKMSPAVEKKIADDPKDSTKRAGARTRQHQ